MHATYTFDFLATVSKQLIDRLESLTVTPLNGTTLGDLQQFQLTTGFAQGVYLIYEANQPRYLGKADGVCGRLEEHLEKLSGRQNINLADIGYKALLLDTSMSTAANEELLIRLYAAQHAGMWNGKGFGPKDPGRRRDTTEPNAFDRDHPIIKDFPVGDVNDHETVGTLFEKMKDGLPYVFRYNIGAHGNTPVDVTGVSRNAEALLRAGLSVLPQGGHGAILSYGMVVYMIVPRDYPANVDIIHAGV